MKWDKYYIGYVVSESSIPFECQFAEINGGSIIASVDYDKCNTQGKGRQSQFFPSYFLQAKLNLLIAETTTDYIHYKNEVYYAASSGMNFFSKFDLSCKITKTIDVDMAQIDVVTDLSLMGDIEEEFTLNEYAALVIDGSPEGKLRFNC